MDIINHKINDLISAEYNPRELTKEQHQHLTDSIKRFGIVDPIIINKNKDRKNIIVGGHQRVRVAREIHLDSVPCVELDLTLEQERELNVRLNKNVGQWDYDVLANMFDMDELISWGFDEGDLKIFDEKDGEEMYSKKIKTPIYEVKNSKPLIEDLFDDKKTKELLKEIEESSADPETKEFLKLAATRHCMFNYSKIADFYVHSGDDVKKMMEDSALVIIDYEKAIENGFVEMTEYMRELQLDDE